MGVLLYKYKNNPKTLIYTYAACCIYYEFVSATAIYARIASFTEYHLGIIGDVFAALCMIMTGTSYAFTPMTYMDYNGEIFSG